MGPKWANPVSSGSRTQLCEDGAGRRVGKGGSERGHEAVHFPSAPGNTHLRLPAVVVRSCWSLLLFPHCVDESLEKSGNGKGTGKQGTGFLFSKLPMGF